MDIYVDTFNTKKTANEILEIASNLDSYIKQLTSIIDRIDSAWDGDDSIKYINTMRDKLVLELQNLSKFVANYGSYLSSAPEAYTILDEVFSSKNIGI